MHCSWLKKTISDALIRITIIDIVLSSSSSFKCFLSWVFQMINKQYWPAIFESDNSIRKIWCPDETVYQNGTTARQTTPLLKTCDPVNDDHYLLVIFAIRLWFVIRLKIELIRSQKLWLLGYWDRFLPRPVIEKSLLHLNILHKSGLLNISVLLQDHLNLFLISFPTILPCWEAEIFKV